MRPCSHGLWSPSSSGRPFLLIGTAFLLAGVVGSGAMAEIERVVRANGLPLTNGLPLANGLPLTSRAAACV